MELTKNNNADFEEREVYETRYVRTAFAKGLTERRVIFIHALRNSLIPIVTGLGHAFGLLLAG